MAFSWAGDLTGAKPIRKLFPIAADVYQGQLLMADITVTGGVKPTADAAAGPDTASQLIGICTGIVTSPTFNSTYKGDKGVYDVTQATLTANDPVGPAMAEVILLTPTTLVKGPIVKATIGTNPERKACTTGSDDGLTFIIAAIDATESYFSTAYCSIGANAGQSRIVTTGATATQTFIIPFTYDIAVGDTFCVVNVREGKARIELDTQFQGIDSSAALTNYFNVYVHQLNLEEAGKEYAVFTFDGSHLVIG
ncbi:MAG: hypothetical protein Q7K21_00235 [Elusimicrobiota bacterium]|nr:hypothetical protein [Elusimicrobiota bacterium]